MSLNFFADHCVPNSLIQVLNAYGHAVHRLTDHLPADSADKLIIEKAKHLNAILLSLNGDFADIVAYPPSSFAGIICIQLKNRPSLIPQLMKGLRSYIEKNPGQKHYAGKLLVVDISRVRIRE